MKYIFGEYKNEDFCFKKVNESWICENNVTFNALRFPANNAAKKVKDTLAENFKGISFYKLNLREAHSERELKQLLKTTLGCLSDNSSTDVATMFKADTKATIKDLDDDVLKKLQAIAEGKETKRTLSTQYLSKAWITVRGANKNIRNLNTKQGAYLFAYLNDGTIFEGTSASKVYQYKITLKGITADDIAERFEHALKLTSDSKEIQNTFKFNKREGQGVIICFGKKTSIDDVNLIQKTFRDAFTEVEDEDTKKSGKDKLKDLANKFVTALKGLFKNGKPVDNLKDYEIVKTDFEMFYSQEEANLAKEIVLLQDRKIPSEDEKKVDKEEPKKEEPKAEEPKKDAEKALEKDDAKVEQPAETDKKKKTGFSNTTIGNRIRRPNYKAKHPETYKNAGEAARTLKKNFDQDAASVMLATAGEAIKGSAWNSKKKLGDVLRQVDLIEDAELSGADKAFINTTVTDLYKEFGTDLDEDIFGELIDDEISRYVFDALDLGEIQEAEINAFTSNLTNYAFEVFSQKTDNELTEALDSGLSFDKLQEIAEAFAADCKRENIEIEEICKDYYENVRCIKLFTKNLNSLLIGRLQDKCFKLMDDHPEVAVELDASRKFGYFYGREICLMIASEYYID